MFEFMSTNHKAIIFLILLSGCATNPKDIVPKIISSKKYQGMNCNELMIQRLAVDNKRLQTYNDMKEQKREVEMCQGALGGTVIGLPFIGLCLLSEDSELAEQLGIYKGEIRAIDSKISQCKARENKTIINNKNIVNIDGKRRNPTNHKQTETGICGDGGETCAELGLLEEKKGNKLKARRLYRMACKSGHRLACRAAEQLK